MPGKKLSLEEKESLYILKMTELQVRWQNPIPDDWEPQYENEQQLDKMLDDVIGQLKFEKALSAVRCAIKIPIFLFIILGIVGLLVFGIRQLL